MVYDILRTTHIFISIFNQIRTEKNQYHKRICLYEKILYNNNINLYK